MIKLADPTIYLRTSLKLVYSRRIQTKLGIEENTECSSPKQHRGRIPVMKYPSRGGKQSSKSSIIQN
ncbi:hypothetical protein Avbf_00525 [Armadillidium vulgare]|nr:hypothetical protein Avbf_00525 [Armadillidium vulgare]